MKTYYYGVKYEPLARRTNANGQQDKLVPFVQKDPPQTHVVMYEKDVKETTSEVMSELLCKAKALRNDIRKLTSQKTNVNNIVVQNTPKREAIPGTIVKIEDGDKKHQALVLRVGVFDADVLIFSSRPKWAKKFRRATSDELSLAGFHTSKETFLCFANRSREFIYSTGITYPERRVFELEREFVGTYNA